MCGPLDSVQGWDAAFGGNAKSGDYIISPQFTTPIGIRISIANQGSCWVVSDFTTFTATVEQIAAVIKWITRSLSDFKNFADWEGHKLRSHVPRTLQLL